MLRKKNGFVGIMVFSFYVQCKDCANVNRGLQIWFCDNPVEPIFFFETRFEKKCSLGSTLIE